MSTTNKQNNEHHHILSEESIKTYNSSLKKMAKLNIECDENNLFNVMTSFKNLMIMTLNYQHKKHCWLHMYGN